MPGINEINHKNINKYSFAQGNKLAEKYGVNKKVPAEEGKPAADFLNGLMALYSNLKQAVLDNNELLEESTDDIRPNESVDEFRKNLEETSFDQSKVTSENASVAWNLDGTRVAKGIGGMLSRGILSDVMEKPKSAGLDTVDKQAAFYLKVVDPLMRNDGKLFKEILREHVDFSKVQPIDQHLVKEKIEGIYKFNKQVIDNKLNSNKELSAKIDDLRINSFELERQSGFITYGPKKEADLNNINNEEKLIELPKVKDPARKEVLSDRREQIKEQVYSARNIKNPTFENGRSLFGSVKILAVGKESTEHSLLRKAADEYDNYKKLESKEKDSLVPDDPEEVIAIKLLMIDDVKRHANNYADLKTAKGIPSTPAGKDRLAGAYAIRDGAQEDLKDIENDIKEETKFKSISEFRKSDVYLQHACSHLTDKLQNMQFKMGDPLIEIEQKTQVCNLIAHKMQAEPKNFVARDMFFKDMSVAQITDKLMHSATFDRYYREKVAEAGGLGAEIISDTAGLMNKCSAGFNAELKNASNSEIKNDAKDMKQGIAETIETHKKLKAESSKALK